MPDCSPYTANISNFHKNCLIIGNAAKLTQSSQTKQMQFSAVYDDRFVRDVIKPEERTAVENHGKTLALEQLSRKLGLSVVLYAGNSGGDTYAMRQVLSNNNTMGIFVQPSLSKSTTFKEILNSSLCTTNTCVEIIEPR